MRVFVYIMVSDKKPSRNFYLYMFLQVDVYDELYMSDGRVVSLLANFSPTSKVSQREAS